MFKDELNIKPLTEQENEKISRVCNNKDKEVCKKCKTFGFNNFLHCKE